MAWEAPFLDGFDHYATADIGSKWDTTVGGVSISTTTVRNSVGSLNITSSSGSVIKNTASSRNFCVGYAVRYTASQTAANAGAAGAAQVVICDGLAGTVAQVALCLFSDGKFRLVRTVSVDTSGICTTPTTLATGTFVVSTGVFYYLELKVFLDGTTGKFELKIDGTVDVTFTGNTVAQGTNQASKVVLRGTANGVFIEDVQIRVDSAASTETSGGYLGDISVKPYYPNADGTYTAMTCSTGSTHYTLVDETSPNTTDYVSSATASTKDSFGFQDASGAGAIKAVQLSAYAYKNDSGFRGIDLFCRSSSTENFSSYKPLSITPRYLTQGWLTDPNTSADWSQANFNAAEFGVRVSTDL